MKLLHMDSLNPLISLKMQKVVERERERERPWVKLTERKSNTKISKIKVFIDLLIFFNQTYQLEKIKYLNILHTHTHTHTYIYKLIDYL